jgi:predicted nucleic acid-binding protein
MTAKDAVAGVQRLLLDTNPVIYILEKDATFAPRTWAVLQAALAAGAQLVLSPLTLIEVLSKPGMSEAELKRSAEFCLATNEIEFEPLMFDDVFAIRVGYFRRTTGVKTPDCIQFACAEALQCDAILTNDSHYARHPSAQCLDLSQITP